MLTPVPMVRVELLALDRDLVALSERIGEMAVLHPLDVRQVGDWAGVMAWTEMDNLAAEYESVRRRLDRLVEFLGSPQEEVGAPVQISPQEVLRRASELLERAEPEAKGPEDRRRDLESSLLRLEGLRAQLELLRRLEVDLDELRRLRFLYMASGLIPPENVRRLEESLREVPHVLIPIRRVGERMLLFAFTRPQEMEVLDRALQSAYFERMDIPAEFSGTPAQALEQLEARRVDLERQNQAAEQERALLRDRWGEPMQAMRAEVEVNLRVVAVWRQAGRTERTRLLAGWVPRSSYRGFAAAVAATTAGRSLLAEAEPSPSEEAAVLSAPTALRNPAPLRPFEPLIVTYGLPDYWDLDPTPLAALLFLVMFGAMFGDLGQGAVLVGVGIALALGRILDGQRDFGFILAGCGVSAMVFGVLYGSLFATEGLLPALWFRPMSNPVLLIEVAIAFGAVVLSVGLILGVVSAWRRHDWIDLYLGQTGLVGLWLYWGLLLVAVLAVFDREQLSLLTVAPLIGVPLVLLLLREPLGRVLGWVDRPQDGAYAIQSGVETFDLVVRFASNTVSFLRLGAFALGHAGLGLTIFALAELVHGLPGASFGVLVLGNAVILSLEALIVGIQALRLEYYEFFTKFLHGGGVPYRPFAFARRGVGSDSPEREG